jgi:hypothetical protein
MSETNWQKSSYSGQGEGSSCIELAAADSRIALREGDDPDIVIATTAAQIRSLLQAVRIRGRLTPGP